ncbi:MAG: sigma-70 family RNA polymerase sigma factor [Elusimicrobia bacterium]|nr:sigma-70 family RNA polymerase sigma factor [Elusimicrobiota bacterium]
MLDFEPLYRECRDRVFQLAFRMLGDRERAVEATQAAFVKAYEGRAGFAGRSSPRTWLYRIAFNACLDQLRRREAAPAAPEPLVDGPESRPAALLERAETVRRVRAALARLGVSDRSLLCLLMERDLPYRELAVVLDCPESAVRMRVSRARRRLRELLSPVEEP